MSSYMFNTIIVTTSWWWWWPLLLLTEQKKLCERVALDFSIKIRLDLFFYETSFTLLSGMRWICNEYILFLLKVTSFFLFLLGNFISLLIHHKISCIEAQKSEKQKLTNGTRNVTTTNETLLYWKTTGK